MKTDYININDCLEGEKITLKISGIKKFTLRLQIAMFFIRVAAWVMPIDTDIKITEEHNS